MKFPRGTTRHPINKSGKRKLLVSVWDFKAIHPQSEREHYVCNDHPAKMRPALARAILRLYGKSPVLDPMAGIGTTLVEAMLLGMDAVGVEFEQRFVSESRENIESIREGGKNTGDASCLKGDARSLSFLQGKFGSILFSPPYFDALSVKKGGGSKKSIAYEETTEELQMKRSGPFAVKKNLPTPYSSKKDNIGNLSKKSSYFQEMLKVYTECYRVLKPGRFMVVVVKDIQRDWKTIPLGADTIKLCQEAGFDCHDVIINKMYFPSFWMLALAKRAQTEGLKNSRKFHALKTHEYALVFRKPSE